MVWTVLWWSGNGRYCFVQLSTLVCSVSDLQSIPYSGGCPTYTIFSELYIEYCLCMFPYGLSCPVWCLGSFSSDFLLCSVTYRFVLVYCSDDVCSLLIGVFELRIGVNSDNKDNAIMLICKQSIHHMNFHYIKFNTKTVGFAAGARVFF